MKKKQPAQDDTWWIERECIVTRTKKEYVRIHTRIKETPSSALNEANFSKKEAEIRKMVIENPDSFFWLQVGYKIDEKEKS